jgi:outer membrane receptor for Fe3+-dicitrate
MNKKYSFYIILAVLLLSACIKAYEPPVVKTYTYTVNDVVGVYKNGSLNLEKGYLDSLVYKLVDDTSNFSLTYYYNDTILVSINTYSSLSTKKYKLGLLSNVSNSEGAVFKFQKIKIDSLYFLNKQVYNLEVTLYYPDLHKTSTAVITNNNLLSYNPSTIYIENVLFNAKLQPK